MGGLNTEVGDDTTDVLLEAANFEPIGILRTSERLGLRTDSSNRWEKGVDPHLAEPAARLASEMIVELAGWTLDRRRRRARRAPRPAGRAPAARARGRPDRRDTAPARQREILERLGFGVADDWQVTVPTWRARDVTREIDLVEEIARFELERVPFTMPQRRELFGRLTREQRLRREVEEVLLGCGLSETYTPSLVRPDASPDGCAAGPADRRARRPAHQPAAEPRRGRAPEPRRRRGRGRAVRDREGLPARRRAASRTSAGGSPGSCPAGSSARRA